LLSIIFYTKDVYICPMLKRIIIILLVVSCTWMSCSHDEPVPNTDIDVARAFITDILNDHFDKAKVLVLQDEENVQFFNLFGKQYHNKNKTELDNFKNASIIINEINNLNDSETVINYSNTFKKDHKNVIKTVRLNGKWLVDFKYTFSGNL